MDYNDKIIGLIIEREKITGFIPCYPSGLNFEINIPYNF